MSTPGASLTLVVAVVAGVVGSILPLAAADVDILHLGPLFADDDALATFTSVGQRGCLPMAFTRGNSALVAASCFQRSGCPGVPRDIVFYNCLANGLGLIEDGTFNISAVNATITRDVPSADWSPERQLLLDACLAGLVGNMTAGQQAAGTLICWQWSMLLECDLHETLGPLSGGASWRRAAFLTGNCPLSPRPLLTVLGTAGQDRVWETCADQLTTPVGTETDAELPTTPAGTETDADLPTTPAGAETDADLPTTPAGTETGADLPTTPAGTETGADLPTTPAGTETDADLPTTPAGAETDADIPTTPAGTETDADLPTTPAGTETDADLPTTPAGAETDADLPTTPAGAETDTDLPTTPAGAETSADRLAIPTGTKTDADRRLLDSAAIDLVSCVLQDYTDSSTGVIDLDRMTADIESSDADQAAKSALLTIVRGCKTGSGSTVRQFIMCWAMHGIMSCATKEASQLVHTYQPC